MMLEGLPLMSAGSRESGVVEAHGAVTCTNGDVGRRALDYYRESTRNGVGIIGDNYDRLLAREDIVTTLDSRWQSVADGMLRNGDADLAHNDDVLGTCMVVGNSGQRFHDRFRGGQRFCRESRNLAAGN